MGKRIAAAPSTKQFPQITECPLTENVLVLSSLSDLSMSDKISNSMEPAKNVSGAPEMRKVLKYLNTPAHITTFTIAYAAVVTGCPRSCRSLKHL